VKSSRAYMNVWEQGKKILDVDVGSNAPVTAAAKQDMVFTIDRASESCLNHSMAQAVVHGSPRSRGYWV